jgi:aminopeptidase-like protein
LTHHTDFYADAFRKIIGNDETVWEAPGYEIPTVSLSRWPYPEYHTNRDNESIISEDMLEESVQTLIGITEVLETNCKMVRKFRGLVALSNPRYDLYLKPGTDPSTRDRRTEQMERWNYLMDCLPRYFDGKMTILDVAVKHGLPYEELYRYVCRFKERMLIDFVA